MMDQRDASQWWRALVALAEGPGSQCQHWPCEGHSLLEFQSQRLQSLPLASQTTAHMWCTYEVHICTSRHTHKWKCIVKSLKHKSKYHNDAHYFVSYIKNEQQRQGRYVHGLDSAEFLMTINSYLWVHQNLNISRHFWRLQRHFLPILNLIN